LCEGNGVSNALTIQTTVDGPRNVVSKVVAKADTSDFSLSTVINVSALSATIPPTDQVRIDEIQYSVQDGWYVVLYWEATTNKRIVNLSGRGIFPVGPNYGGIQNDAGVGKTGNILLSTVGYTSGTMVATLILHCVKQTSLEASEQSADLITTEGGDPLTTESGVELVTE
jgi:hypothetical protein